MGKTANKGKKTLKTGTLLDTLIGKKFYSFIELAELLEKIPSIRVIDVKPPEGESLDGNSLATLSYLAALFNDNPRKPHPATLKVKTYKKGRYSVGVQVGSLWFEVGYGRIEDVPEYQKSPMPLP
jgi:hypothetical protein